MFGLIDVEKSPGTVTTYCKRFPGTQKNEPLKISITIFVPRKRSFESYQTCQTTSKKKFVLHENSSCKKKIKNTSIRAYMSQGNKTLKFEIFLIESKIYLEKSY